MNRYVARIWVDVIVHAESEEQAKIIAKRAVNTFAYKTNCPDLEEYDMQFEGTVRLYDPE